LNPSKDRCRWLRCPQTGLHRGCTAGPCAPIGEPEKPNAQQLGVFSTDGGTTWSIPVFVGNDVAFGEPVCNFGDKVNPLLLEGNLRRH
jgi:hypothetical protein